MATSAEAMAAKFLNDLIKSRESVTNQAVSSAVAASAPVQTPVVPVRAPMAPRLSQTNNAAPSQQLAATLQAKSNATDELMQIMDSADMDIERVGVLKQTIQDLNTKLKLLEAQEAAARIAVATAGGFADDRVMSAGPSSARMLPLTTSTSVMNGSMLAPVPDNRALVDISPTTFSGKHQTGPPPGYKTRKQREAEELERLRMEEERVKREGGIKLEMGKHMKGDMVLSDTTLYVEPNWHTSVAAGPTLECDPLCRSPLESVVVELLKHVEPGDVGRVGLTPDSSSPRAYIHFLDPEKANRLLCLLTPNATKLLCRVGTHEYRLMRAKPKQGQDYALRPPCNQIWVRGTVLSDEKLLQNLSRFGKILGHTRSSREVTVTFDNDESALKAIKTLPTERQWWGAYINFAQQAQLVSLKNGSGYDNVKLEPKEEMDEFGGGYEDGRYFGGPRRPRRRARHSGPLMGRGGSPGTEFGDEPMHWPEFEVKPEKEEPFEPGMPANYSPYDERGPPRREQEPYYGGPDMRDWGPPPGPDYHHDPYGGPPPGHYPPQHDPYQEPYYRGAEGYDARDGFHGYGPPPQGDFYNGPPPPMHNNGPMVHEHGPPMHDPYFQRGPPPEPDYRGGPFPPFNGPYPPPNDFGPPHFNDFGGPPPPPNGNFGSYPPHVNHHQPHRNTGVMSMRGNHMRGQVRHPLPDRPSLHVDRGSGEHKPSSMALESMGMPAPDSEPAFHIKAEPDLDLDQQLHAPLPAQPAASEIPSGGKKAPIDFFRSNLDESTNDAAAPQPGSAWGSGSGASNGFKPYQSALGTRR